MTRRFYSFVLLFFISLQASAQMYWQVTHGSGTQNVGNFPVTVTRVGLDTMWQITGTMGCPNVGPYQISAQNGTLPECGYMFSFVNPVDSVRLRFHALHVNELVRIDINGTTYNLTMANLNTSNILCAGPSPAPAAVVNGKITCNSSNTSDYADVEVNIQTSYNIDSIKVLDNSTTNATLFYFAFVNNSCDQDLNAQANSPCVGNALFLRSLNIPDAVYSWTGPGGYTSGQEGPTRTNVPLSAGGDYIVTASFGNGCFRADTVNVTVHPLPPAPIATSNSPVCVGDTLKLFATNSTPGALYVWSGPNSFSATQQNVAIAPAATTDGGNYLIVAVVNGCMSTPMGTHVDINTNTITPNVSISASPGTVVTAATTVTFTATTNLGSGATFQWRKNGQPISGATNDTWSSATLVNGDVIDVIAGSDALCVLPDADTSNTLTITLKSGIGTVTGNATPALFPNPNNGDFTISGDVPSGTVTLDVYDALGRAVWSGTAVVQNNVMKQQLHLPDVLPGVYYLRITSAAGSDVMAFTIK